MEVGEGGDGPEAKRRKAFTKRETLQKLEELGNNVSLAVSEMVSDLSPFDVNDENVGAFEERNDKLDKVASSLTRKIYRLKEEVKARRITETIIFLTKISSPVLSTVCFNLPKKNLIIFRKLSPSQSIRAHMPRPQRPTSKFSFQKRKMNFRLWPFI